MEKHIRQLYKVLVGKESINGEICIAAFDSRRVDTTFKNVNLNIGSIGVV